MATSSSLASAATFPPLNIICSELKEVDRVRKESEEIMRKINEYHEKLTASLSNNSNNTKKRRYDDDDDDDERSTNITLTEEDANMLRELYENAVNLAEREEDVLLACLEKIDDLISNAGGATPLSAASTPSTTYAHAPSPTPTTTTTTTTAAAAAATPIPISTTGKRAAQAASTPSTPAAAVEQQRPAGKSKRPKIETATGRAGKTEIPAAEAKAAAAAPTRPSAAEAKAGGAAASSTSYNKYLYPDQATSNIIPKGAQVAAKVSSSKEGGFWILASVVQYMPDKQRYKVVDEDPGDENDPNPVKKQYILPEKNVIPLPKTIPDKFFSKGQHVLAMFPDTTTFYPAVVDRPPARTGNRKTADYYLKFADDEEEPGVTPSRKVPFQHVVEMPQH